MLHMEPIYYRMGWRWFYIVFVTDNKNNTQMLFTYNETIYVFTIPDAVLLALMPMMMTTTWIMSNLLFVL